MVLKDNQTHLTFHNGLTTIGGTLVEISYNDYRIFFDFGSEFNPKLNPQPKCLKDILAADLFVYVDNLYDKKIDLQDYNHQSQDVYTESAVFVSHIHLDHSKMINFVDDSINVYMSKESKYLLETLNINNDFLYANPNIEGNTRDIIGVEFNETIKVGEIEVTILPIDHDAYGASGFLIKTPDKTIAYTGDLRLHGYDENITKNYCNYVKKCDILIMEGVTLSFKTLEESLQEDNRNSEKLLLDKFSKLVNDNSDKQITFNYYIANVDRILQLSKLINREIVLSAYNAYCVKQVSGIEFKYYNFDDNNYGLNKDKQVSIDELQKHQSKYLWQIDEEVYEKIDLLDDNGMYIHSNAAPFDYDPAYQSFKESFINKNIDFIRLDCTGHAYPQDLFKVIDMIQPKLLIPLHSKHPERLINKYGDVLLPYKGQTI